MTVAFPRLGPLGDGALTLTFGATITEPAQAEAARVAGLLAGADLDGVIEIVPGYVAVTVHYDREAVSFPDLRDAVARTLTLGPKSWAPTEGRPIEIPVRYDGPDLASVATATGMPIEEVIARHTGAEYRVAMLGFVPGFGYLGPLDPRLVLPRRSTPRPRVPAGSVAIGGEQTGVYPAETPGGWHLLGTTSVSLFDPDRDPPALLQVGDRVRFTAI